MHPTPTRLAAVAALLAATAGCIPLFPSIDEACLDEVPGGELLDDPAVIARVNCYRRFVQLPELAVGAGAQRSATSHLAYLETSEALDDGSGGFVGTRNGLLTEVDSEEGFLGKDPFARAVAVGSVSTATAFAAAGVWGWFSHDGTDSGDVLIAHPYVRDFLFQPLPLEVGYATQVIGGTQRAYMELYASLPSGRRVADPIIFPRDGQEGVPTGWRDSGAFANETLFSETPFGYPVTVTVSEDATSGVPYDPFALRATDVVLTHVASDTILAVTVDTPRLGTPFTLRTTLVVIPDTPLEANAEYRFQASLSTVGLSHEIDSRFTTGRELVVE